MRVEQERKNLSPDDPFEQSGVSDAGAAPIGSFSGTQTQTGRLFAGRLKSKNRQTVILYLESYIGTPQETAALADEILSGYRSNDGPMILRRLSVIQNRYSR